MKEPTFEDVTRNVAAFTEALKTVAEYIYAGGRVDEMSLEVQSAVKVVSEFFGEDFGPWLREDEPKPSVDGTNVASDALDMANTPKAPPLVPINEKTIDQLNDKVAKYYDLLKSGKGAGKSKEGDEALRELADAVHNRLRYDEASETWVNKDG